MSISADDLLDVEAAAAYIGCSIWTIRYRIQRLGLVPTRVMGQAHFFTTGALDAHFADVPLIEGGRRRHT
jgi:hypothetical protein